MNQQRQSSPWWTRVIIIILLGICASLLASRFFAQRSVQSTPVAQGPVVTIQEIAPLAELTTIQFQSVADITFERAPDNILKYLGAKETVTMLVYGNVKAGFDLNKLTEEDLWTDGRRVRLILPPPKILSSSIDFERTRIVAYDRTFFLPNDPELSKETLAQAKDKIIQSAVESGILDLASEHGKLILENYLRALGFEEIQVIIQ